MVFIQDLVTYERSLAKMSMETQSQQGRAGDSDVTAEDEEVSSITRRASNGRVSASAASHCATI